MNSAKPLDQNDIKNILEKLLLFRKQVGDGTLEPSQLKRARRSTANATVSIAALARAVEIREAGRSAAVRSARR